TAWAGQQLIMRAGASHRRLVVLTMLLVATLTALISVNGAVAALVPMVVVLAVRLKQSPSQLLMPLAFAAHAGSMLALTGTPVNVLVSEAAADAGAGQFGFFEFTLVGIPLVAGTVTIVVLLGSRLLPDRQAKVIPPDLSDHARTLVVQYELDAGGDRLRVGPMSPIVGRERRDLDLADHPDVTLVGVQRAGSLGIDAASTIVAGDILVVRGTTQAVAELARTLQLDQAAEGTAEPDALELINRRVGVSELVVPPRSELIGERVFPGMVSTGGDLVVLAVQRKGEDQGPTETVLASGDTLLVRGTWDALEQQLADPDVMVVDAPGLVRRQAVPLGAGAKRALSVLAAMVVLLATGAVPAVVAGLLAAGALVLLRVVTMEQAYRSISWTTIVLVGAMTSLSVAMQQTGAAAKLADGLVRVVGDAGPYALLAGLFVLTATLGQLISNMATALIVIPIAVSAASEIDVSVRPVLMAVTVAASASFLTPVATPANLMVMGPGGYKFGDYWKLGGCLLALFFVVATFYVPIIWGF
ncbi:MAG TPA: SLC13 family permease, partial [Ilumatobacteraceae bacterium]